MSGCQVQVSGAAPSQDRVQKPLCHFKSLHRGTDCSTPAVAIDFQRNDHVDPLTTFNKFIRISPHYCEFHLTPALSNTVRLLRLANSHAKPQLICGASESIPSDVSHNSEYSWH